MRGHLTTSLFLYSLLFARADVEALWAWGKANGADISQVELAHSSLGERGLFYRGSTDAREDKVLFSIPENLVWTSRVASQSESLRRSLKGVIDLSPAGFTLPHITMGSSMDTLAASVAHEHLLGTASVWFHYLDSIPDPTSPSYAIAVSALGGGLSRGPPTSTDLSSKPQLVSDAILLARQISESYAPSRYAARIIQNQALDNLQLASALSVSILENATAEETRKVVLWAWETVRSRAVYMNEHHGSGLIPFWDSINHGPHKCNDSCLRRAETDKNGSVPRLEYLQHGNDVETDSEVLHDYGFQSDCPLDWLLKFGFLPANFFDVAATSASECMNDERGVACEEANSFPVGCAQIDFAGSTWQLPHDYQSLIDHVATDSPGRQHSISDLYSEKKFQQDNPKQRLHALKHALEARATELPTQAKLINRISKSEPGRQHDHNEHHDFCAAVIMILERQTLLHAARCLGL